ncbi:MAG: hypothetical protein AAB368_12645, partial [bacterium]
MAEAGEEGYLQVRNVAEYAYCPRLFYYMQVEGVFLPSADTEKGSAVHKRVDRPSKADKPAENGEGGAEDEPDKPRAVRSLALSSAKLGITGRLDLADIAGSVAVPIEYRKGRPRRIALAPPPDDPGEAEEEPLSRAEPWPTDRVQV